MAASMPPIFRRLATVNPSLVRIRQLPSLHRQVQLLLPSEIRQRISSSVVPLAAAAFSNLQSVISLLWDSILLAVPKQKTSYSKKRSRQLAGKALQDVTNLNHCSACGRIKRAHILCPYCVALIKDMWKNTVTKQNSSETDLQKPSSTASATWTKSNPLKFPKAPTKK